MVDDAELGLARVDLGRRASRCRDRCGGRVSPQRFQPLTAPRGAVRRGDGGHDRLEVGLARRERELALPLRARPSARTDFGSCEGFQVARVVDDHADPGETPTHRSAPSCTSPASSRALTASTGASRPSCCRSSSGGEFSVRKTSAGEWLAFLDDLGREHALVVGADRDLMPGLLLERGHERGTVSGCWPRNTVIFPFPWLPSPAAQSHRERALRRAVRREWTSAYDL